MSRRVARLLPVILLLGGAAPRSAAACTTFMLERGGERVVGKSYDWYMGQGLVVVNKRGVGKQAVVTSAATIIRPRGCRATRA